MDWMKRAIFYHIYPLGFCGAPMQNSCDETVYRLDQINEWIPHMKSLGVNALYLGPVFESGEHGYDTWDYYKVDRRLGDNQSFKAICQKLHENGIRIILDGVFNHVGRGFWAFEDVRKNLQNSSYCSWFHNLNFGGSSPEGDPFWYEGWQGHYNLVKLNLHNPDVVNHLLGAVGMWMEQFGIDGLRLDAADCVDMDFFRRLREFCKSKNSDFWLMGEIIHGDYNRWANPSMLDSVTNYECHKGLYSSHNDKNYFEIAYSLNRQFGNGGIYKNLCLYNFVDNHDVARLASKLNHPEHLQNVYTILYTMPGCPSIYYGSEWGIQGQKKENSDAPMRPHLTLGQIPDANESLCQWLQTLGKIRLALPALQFGSYEQMMVKNEQFAYLREWEGKQVYTALNLAGNPAYVEFRVKFMPLVDLLTGTRFESNDGNLKLELPAYGCRILVSPSVYERVAPALHMQPESSAPLSTPAPQSEPELIVPTEAPRPGRYRHFKGNEYEVIGVAKHSETLEELVVYRPLYGEGGLWVRPLSMFNEIIERDGKKMLRFTYIDN